MPISVFARRVEASFELAHALAPDGACLIVDVCGRLAAQTPVRPLQDWRQQLRTGQLRGVAWRGVELVLASGALAGDAGLCRAARGYRWLVFDAGMPAAGAGLTLADAAHTLVIDAASTSDAGRAYALVRALCRLDTSVHCAGSEALTIQRALGFFGGNANAVTTHRDLRAFASACR